MRKLYLSKKNSKIFGVCGGIGETYDIDPLAIRLATVFLFLATAIIPVLITYILAWLFIPQKPTE
jgi:phage shock protein C